MNLSSFILNVVCVFSNFLDIAEVPICEISLACDNLLCDGHGRPPNPSLVVDVYMPSSKFWVQYGRTEIVEVFGSYILMWFFPHLVIFLLKYATY